MKRHELQKKLVVENINPNAYSLFGADYNECYVLSKEHEGKWIIYYSERGLKTNQQNFTNEDDACDAFLKILLNDPLAKNPPTPPSSG